MSFPLIPIQGQLSQPFCSQQHPSNCITCLVALLSSLPHWTVSPSSLPHPLNPIIPFFQQVFVHPSLSWGQASLHAVAGVRVEAGGWASLQSQKLLSPVTDGGWSVLNALSSPDSGSWIWGKAGKDPGSGKSLSTFLFPPFWSWIDNSKFQCPEERF